MNCSVCGSPLQPGQTSCPVCGAQIQAQPTQQPVYQQPVQQPVQPQQMYQQPTQQPVQPQQMYQQPTQQPVQPQQMYQQPMQQMYQQAMPGQMVYQQPKKKKTGLIVTLIIVGVLAIAAGIATPLMIRKVSKKTMCENCYETKKCHKYEITMSALGVSDSGQYWLCEPCKDQVKALIEADGFDCTIKKCSIFD